jgi:hypothetical protein
MADQFHVGQRVRLKRKLRTLPRRQFPKGATGAVIDMDEITIWVKMDRHFPHLRGNILTVTPREITGRPRGLWARLRAAWGGGE